MHGELLQVAAVALCVGVVLAQPLLLFAVVKFAGAAYLIYTSASRPSGTVHRAWRGRTPYGRRPPPASSGKGLS